MQSKLVPQENQKVRSRTASKGCLHSLVRIKRRGRATLKGEPQKKGKRTELSIIFSYPGVRYINACTLYAAASESRARSHNPMVKTRGRNKKVGKAAQSPQNFPSIGNNQNTRNLSGRLKKGSGKLENSIEGSKRGTFRNFVACRYRAGGKRNEFVLRLTPSG